MPGTWSSGGNLAVARHGLAGAGIQTAGLCMGGYNSAITEEYDGATTSSRAAVTICLAETDTLKNIILRAK